jgi:chemotaxis protein MotB
MMTPSRAGRGGHDRWLMPYADMVTVLFAFMTVLYAASRVDSGKLTETASSLHRAFSGDQQTAPAVPARPIGAKPAIVPPVEVVPKLAKLDAVEKELTRALAEDVKLDRAEITRDGRGVVISLPERATFAQGSAEVTPEARALIDRVVAPIASLPNAMRIEGHTDDVPIHTARFSSNWELSTARAAAVVAFLIGERRIPPDRLSAAGYAEFHPRVPNDTPEDRARNRRIDIVVLEQ